MQRLEVSGAVRPIYGSLGVKRLKCTAIYPSAPTRLHNTVLLQFVSTFCFSRKSVSLLRFVAAEYLTGEPPLWFPTVHMR